MDELEHAGLIETEARRICAVEGRDEERWPSMTERAAEVVHRRFVAAAAARAYGDAGERRKDLNRRRG